MPDPHLAVKNIAKSLAQRITFLHKCRELSWLSKEATKGTCADKHLTTRNGQSLPQRAWVGSRAVPFAWCRRGWRPPRGWRVCRARRRCRGLSPLWDCRWGRRDLKHGRRFWRRRERWRFRDTCRGCTCLWSVLPRCWGRGTNRPGFRLRSFTWDRLWPSATMGCLPMRGWYLSQG